MHQTLFTIGPFSLSVFSLFLVFGFFVTAFTFWRRTKEEHYPEYELFDKFLLAVVVGMVVGRVGYILGHYAEFGFSLGKWLNIFAFGGFSGLLGLVGATFYLAFVVKQKKWDVFEILDYWVTSLSLGVAFIYIGLFFDGPGNGLVTNLPWGVIFPGQNQPHHPVALYWAVFYILLFIFLSWAEYHYRTFSWYRAGKKAAQTGFLTASFLIFLGLFSLIINAVMLPQLMVYSIRVDYILSLVIVILGVGLMIVRSGRLKLKKQRPPNIYVKSKVS